LTPDPRGETVHVSGHGSALTRKPMTQKPTLGSAIDQLISVLEPLDSDTRQVAIVTACTVLKIEAPKLSNASGDPVVREASRPRESTAAASEGSVAPKAPVAPPRDIRALKEEKRPRTAREMACVIAFYLQELAAEQERKETISTEDLEKYFKQAGFKLPKAIDQTLKDAKAAGYFDSPTRGAYKLNAVGYNLVAHKLPVAGSEA
jgi:hypothetical protein